MRNVALTVSKVSRARPPRSTPTPIAAGRFRPVLMTFGSGSAARAPGGRSSGTGSSAAMSEIFTGRSLMCAAFLRSRAAGFLVLEQLIDLGNVLIGELLQLALGAAHIVLARLGV